MQFVYGLLGEKLEHSISPLIHSIIHKDFSIDGVYSLFETDKINLKNTIDTLVADNVVGVNVTIPYKRDVISFLDEISVEANKIGSVNTLLFRNNKIEGFNTDYFGFEYLLNRFDVSVAGKTALILGTGGVSRTVTQYLIDNHISNIIIASRKTKEEKTNSFHKAIEIISYSEVSKLSKTDLLVNCTPVGMYPNINESPLDLHRLSKFDVVVDLIYNPSKTLLLNYADKLGIKSINGLYMLIAQAAASYKYWNNLNITEDCIDKVYMEVSKLF